MYTEINNNSLKSLRNNSIQIILYKIFTFYLDLIAIKNLYSYQHKVENTKSLEQKLDTIIPHVKKDLC